MDRRWKQLGEFLRARRGQCAPGALRFGERRQVPGLRRHELAALAGVSAAYYTRLEQGRARHVSDDVLRAVCRALALSDADLDHVWVLARSAARPAAPGGDEHVRPAVRHLLDQLGPTPALVLGRDRHLLAWNQAAHALHAPHLPHDAPDDPRTRPWWPALLFCDPGVAERFVDWDAKARDTVADLRTELAERAEGGSLAALCEQLREQDAAFARLWREYPVQTCAHHDRSYRHPTLGEFTLHDEFLALSDDHGQQLAIFTPPPGPTGREALHPFEAPVVR